MSWGIIDGRSLERGRALVEKWQATRRHKNRDAFGVPKGRSRGNALGAGKILEGRKNSRYLDVGVSENAGETTEDGDAGR